MLKFENHRKYMIKKIFRISLLSGYIRVASLPVWFLPITTFILPSGEKWGKKGSSNSDVTTP